MKILHTVESYLPARHGMSEVVRQISERLAARGHEVIVATRSDPKRFTDIINGVRVQSFDVTGKSAVGVYGDVQGYQKFLLENDADVVVNFAAQQWATDLIFPLLPSIRAKKVFVPTGFSALEDKSFRSYFESMRQWLLLYDAGVFLSDDYRDIRFARDCGYERIAIIPNGAAEEEFSRAPSAGLRSECGIPKEHFLAIHVAGYLSVAKGQLEALEIFSESSIRDATLLLVCPNFEQSFLESLTPREILRAGYHLMRGRGFRAFQLPLRLRLAARKYARRNANFRRQIKFVSLPRQKTVDAFQSAQLLLFPSWIECSPIVLFEAAASKTPFLVTDVGNAREIIQWTNGGRLLAGRRLEDNEGSVVANVQEGASMLNNLHASVALREAMAHAAHAAWMSYFTWGKIASKYEELYTALLRGEDIRGRFNAPPAAQFGVIQ